VLAKLPPLFNAVRVTKAANVLQARQPIHYHRGQISILDRAGMEAAVCGCYRVDRETYDALLAAPGLTADGVARSPAAGAMTVALSRASGAATTVRHRTDR
jgi:hypothetical protein